MVGLVQSCEVCDSEDLERLDPINYRCTNCGYINNLYEVEEYLEDSEVWDFEEVEEMEEIEED